MTLNIQGTPWELNERLLTSSQQYIDLRLNTLFFAVVFHERVLSVEMSPVWYLLVLPDSHCVIRQHLYFLPIKANCFSNSTCFCFNINYVLMHKVEGYINNEI